MAWHHGTTTGYSTHRCRCPECHAAWNAYQREYMRERYHGRTRTIGTGDVVRHIEFLIGNGWTVHAIAAAAAVDHQLVYRIRRRENRRIRRVTADKLMGVALDDWPAGSQVPSREALRIIDALNEAGVTSHDIAHKLRVSYPARIRRQTRVQPATRRKLVIAYRYLASQGLVAGELLGEGIA